jgi:nucleotide-binding universal stress UspA family protein
MMKTVLVPTDFSPTAKHAADYAVRFAAQIPGSRVILFHVYDKQGYGSDGTPLHMGEAAEKNLALAAMDNQRTTLFALGLEVPISIIADTGSFSEALERAVADEGADLVIMGINESNMLDRLTMGSATLRLIKERICPVMIVPENAVFQKVEKIAFASDLEDTALITPVSLIRQLCSAYRTPIHVVHAGGYYNPDEVATLARILNDCTPEFHFLQDKGFTRTLKEFIHEEGIHLLIMVSRKHDILDRLFTKNHTQMLAYHSPVPIIAVHESLSFVAAGE